MSGEFVLIDEKIDLSKGKMIVFPSNFMYPHKVELNERYSLFLHKRIW